MHQILSIGNIFCGSYLIVAAFWVAISILIHRQIDESTISGNSLFFPVFVILFTGKRGCLMDIDLREELRKRDELLAGYLKQIEIQEEFIQKQKEMIEYLEDHISKITDIVSGV